MTDPPDIEWLDPWVPESDEDGLLAIELQREICHRHVLFGIHFKAVGRRIDCDDVLFVSDDPQKPIAVVHLTWQIVSDPTWPMTRIFQGWEEWIEHCLMRDHNEYLDVE